MRIEAAFVTSAANAEGFPRDGLAEVALVGRSNVGKSSLINALARQKIARTSAAPGKTRLANIYRVARGAASPVYLVDLPGYGYARGGAASVREFDALTNAYFGRSDGSGARHALLLVDSRHPGLQSDLDAWGWLETTAGQHAVVATKIDKLPRGERIRALSAMQSVFDNPVVPVSAVTGEGLDELWKLIDKLANNSNPTPLNLSSRAAAAPPPRRNPPPREPLRTSRRPRSPKK